MATLSFDQFVKQAGGQPSQVKTLGVNEVPQVPENKESIGGTISNAFKTGLKKVKTGYTQSLNAKNPVELIEGGLKQGAGVIETATSPLAPIFKPVGDVINYAADKISDIPAVQDFAMSKAGKTTERVAEDIADTATIAGTVAGVKGAPKAASKAIGSVENLSNAVKENAFKYPKEIQTALTDKITSIDPQTKNILGTASIEKFDNYVKAGEEAMRDPRKLTPLEQAGEKVDTHILPAIKEDLGRIGSQKAKTLESVGTAKMPNAATEVVDFVRENTRSLKLTPEERNLVNGITEELDKLGKTPTLASADKTVDLLQNTLFEKTRGLSIPVTSRVESIINQAIRKLNDSVKNASKKALGSDEYVALNDAYAKKIELFNKLNKAVGEDAAKGGSLFKKFFSPQDSGTKKMFADIKSEYGIDLAEDATLAKFVMDSLGDTRSQSLLEQIPLSKGGVVSKALQVAEKKLTKPIPKARRIIEKRLQDQ